MRDLGFFDFDGLEFVPTFGRLTLAHAPFYVTVAVGKGVERCDALGFTLRAMHKQGSFGRGKGRYRRASTF